MRTTYAFLIFAVIGLSAHAQRRTIYYNNYWEIVPKEEGSYYRICQLDSGRFSNNQDSRWFVGNVEDFSMDGKLLMKGSYSLGLRDGEFTFYHPNGQIQAIGNFKVGLRTGIWKYFFKNGQLEREVKFPGKHDFASLQTDFVPVSAYDSTGKSLIENGTGQWYFEYEWYGVTDRFIVTGKFEKGKKEDLWTCLQSNQPLYRELYKNNKFIEGIVIKGTMQEKLDQPFDNKFMLPYKFEVTENFMYVTGTSQKHYPFLPFLKDESELKKIVSQDLVNQDTIPDDEKIFFTVDQQAEFPGGIAAMFKFVKQNQIYPKAARRMGIEGKVFVQFIIERDGSISNVKIFRGVNADLDKEAIRLVSIFPKWKPGVQNGKPVKSKFVLPVPFNLN